MRRIALICLALLLMASLSEAAVSKYVSKSDAESFISIKNHYLKQGETAGADLFIAKGKSNYWVVTVKRGESPIAFVAVLDAEAKVIPDSKTVNRDLFKAAYVLWSFRNVEDALKEQNNWFFTTTNVSSLRNLAQYLENEKKSGELGLIYDSVNDLSMRRKINSMGSKLDAMSEVALEISDLINDSITKRNNIYTNPSVSDIPDFIDTYSLETDDPDSILSKLESLITAAIDYENKDVAELKNTISKSDLDLTEKNLFISKASAPYTVSSLTSLRTKLSSNKQNIDDIFLGMDAKISNFLDSFEKRKEMSQVYQLLYGVNEGIEKAAGGELSTLEEAANDILYSNKKQYWAEQSAVSDLDKQWRAAERNFKEEDFASALPSAQKAINDVKKIYKAGFEVEEDQGMDTGLIQNAIIILIALLVILIAFRHRGKIASFFQKGEGEEEEEAIELES